MIFQPTYFPNIETFHTMLSTEEILFETQDYYQKQTYRTRCNIYAANGLFSMNIPIKHQKNIHQYTKDVLIENDFDWQKNHLKTLQNAYRSSPYFEFYENHLIEIYQKKEKYLIEFLFKTIDLSFELLQIQKKYAKTEEYILNYPDDSDFRILSDAKTKSAFQGKKYPQVFESKHGFIPNLSILDLLFNEGPNSVNLL